MTAISTDRLVLNRCSEGDREGFLALYEDPRVYANLGTGDPIPRSDIEEEFDTALEQWERRGFGLRSIVERATGVWIGLAGLSILGDNPVSLPPQDIEIGWWLAPHAWGKGYATEAAVATMDEGFTDQVTDLVWARHTRRNAASGRIIEKIGMSFVRDVTSTQNVPFRIYELRRERWLALRSKAQPAVESTSR